MKHHIARQIIPKIISTVLLTGCASAPSAPVRVEVPVMVPCIGELPPRPAYEFDKLPATATDGEIILALARDWSRGRIYEVVLEAAITGCRLNDLPTKIN
ncbi:hypothetical protein [Janthinobacterium psychrotolerans]|uniref:Uncharacterized protein n=1 Tax=Janthinobacterium psychrotolerans TaxID=1747903 RepID=A0A1A7C416_9BURK|nr:hypothetical protein [Janthinobacterium psychrotolerans]OBV39784.1 hypothetical protein ASR47_10126 [Janthinobacterium psychrotolerans]